MLDYILVAIVSFAIGVYCGYRVGFAGGQFEQYRETIFGKIEKK